MVFSKWRARRQSVKELRKEEAAVHEEYLRMRELDARMLGTKPPSYGIVVGEGANGGERRESAIGLESERRSAIGLGMSTRTSSTSGQSGTGTTRSASEIGLQTTGSTR